MPIERAMAVPRPVLLALLGLGLLASVFLVTRNSSNEAVKSSAAPMAKPAVTPDAPAAGKASKVAAHSKAESHKSAPAKHAKRHRGAAHHARQAKQPHHGAPSGGPAKAPTGSGLGDRVLRAAQALSQDKAVIFFFSNPGAADDVGTRVAMKSLRGMRRVEIFDATLDQLAAYRPMLENVGISQIPSTVIVRPGKKAVLIEGFVDAGTLRQNVADALR
jgi:hypothetical protein